MRWNTVCVMATEIWSGDGSYVVEAESFKLKAQNHSVKVKSGKRYLAYFTVDILGKLSLRTKLLRELVVGGTV